VNAAGAWINSVFARDQQHLAVQAESFARHLFVIDGWRNGYMPQTGVGYFWDEASEYYMRLWFGDSRIVSLCDRVPATPAQFVPETGLITRLAEFLQDRFADQAQALRLLRSWFCFRTYAEDQLPLWGEDPAASGLFWLAAFGGFGMSTSYAAAADAARHIAGERSLSLPDFNPNRARTWESAPEVANY